MSRMNLGHVLGQFAKRIDRELGVREWLRGHPRPPRGGFDLAGEKIIDWGWICVNFPAGPRRALEIGCGESPILPAMLARGYEVTGVDLDSTIAAELNGFTFIKGDFNRIELLPPFDIVVACSTLEHFGLEGRYGSKRDADADLKAMSKIRSLLSTRGRVLITIPIGRDAVHTPWHRVYGKNRLPLLLEGFTIAESCFWTKVPWGPWYETTLQNAFDQPVTLQRYALGHFVLVPESCAFESGGNA
jgi:hypothetical protein